MPFASSVGGKFGFEGVGGGGLKPLDSTQLNTIVAYVRQFMSEYRNPSFYGYNLDGDQFRINDGGSDMYDGGNFTYPWLLAGTQYTSGSGATENASLNIGYANTVATTLDTNFIYASLGYANSSGTTITANHPLTVFGFRNTVGAPVGFQASGNSGADGGGTLASGIINTGTQIQGFTVHSLYRVQGGTSDPSHCNLVILLGHPRWGSVFGTINSFVNQSKDSNGYFFYTSGPSVKGILAITTLLSKASGVVVTQGECQLVINAFVNRIKIATGF